MFTHKVPVSVYVHCYFEIRLRRKNKHFYWIPNFCTSNIRHATVPASYFLVSGSIIWSIKALMYGPKQIFAAGRSGLRL